MVNKEINEIMDEWSELITFNHVLIDYYKYNMHIKELSYLQLLLMHICKRNEKLYDKLDYITMEL